MKFERGETGGYELSHTNIRCPTIGNTGTSCTTIPKIYKMNSRCAFYDPPGFLDSKGPEQEILNGYSNARMFKLGMESKICIVIDHGSLQTARGGLLIQVVKRLIELFDQNFSNIMNSCILVVSKVNLFEFSPAEIYNQVKQIKKGIE